MKYQPDKKQISWAITIFITVSLCIIVAWIVNHAIIFNKGIGTVIKAIAPILYGIVIAFLLNPILNFLERKCFAPFYYRKTGIDIFSQDHVREKMRMRLLSVALSLFLLIAVLIAMVCILVPQLILSVQTIVGNLTVYHDNVIGFFEGLAEANPDLEEQLMSVLVSVESFISDWYTENVAADMSELIATITSTVVSFGKVVWNFIIGMIVSIYLLYSKDTLRGQAKKITYGLFSEHIANEIIGCFRYIDITFIGFITGKILDSIIIGILCFIVTSIIGTPFPALISVIVGITNVVPFFGPWIGAVIGGVIVFMISPIDCLWFVILCLVLQIFDGYFLGPKILGDSTGLSNFWVIFAIMLFGGLWGFVGWIVGVPLFACIYEFTRRIVNHLLRAKGYREISSGHMQKVAYYEKGEELHLGDPKAERYYAARTRGNSWAKALGINSEKGNGKSQRKNEKKERERDGEKGNS